VNGTIDAGAPDVMRSSFLTFVLSATATAAVVVACGSETSNIGGGADGGDASLTTDANGDVLIITDASGDASNDADPPADGPFACGNTTCAATEWCVSPCCGGARPPCYTNPDGGPCPAGFHAGTCPFGGQDGCVQDACKPPPPYCVDHADKAPVGCQKERGSRHLVCLCA
jgi:hypothetical protein